ncbi:cytochrome c [Aurantiacibacter hainanensis]|uniref:cytochrome c n=1 Tax=Aurantiacibacter hainanensis TaxID=3076114 RepID=UPI0030C67649
MSQGIFRRCAKWAPGAASLLLLAACTTAPDPAPYEGNASMGMLIARDSCSSCHAVSLVGQSPDEGAPAFREVINRPGMAHDELANWLNDAHNYPVEMGVHLEPHQVDSLVAYMQRMQAGEDAD